MNFVSGKSVQRFGNRFVCQFQRVLHRFSLNQFGRHGAGGNGAAAAKGFKLDIGDPIVLDFQINFHDIAADRVSHFSNTVSVFENPHISGIPKMVHYFFTV